MGKNMLKPGMEVDIQTSILSQFIEKNLETSKEIASKMNK